MDLQTNVSELLMHAGDFLEQGKEAEDLNPLLYSIVATFLGILATYDDYKNLESTARRDPFHFSTDIPSG